MSILGHRVSMKSVAALAAVMVLAGLLPAMSSTPSREIRLVVREMAFYVEGDFDTPNPPLELKAGERVRIVVRNDERGMSHDFAVPAVDVATDPIQWNERDQVSFEAPAAPGVYEYVCRPHLLMMKGVIRVVSP
jgi:plastocyanin